MPSISDPLFDAVHRAGQATAAAESEHGPLAHLLTSLLLAVLAVGLGLTLASLWIDASRWLAVVVPAPAPVIDPRPAQEADLSTLPLADDELFDEVRYFEDRGR